MQNRIKVYRSLLILLVFVLSFLPLSALAGALNVSKSCVQEDMVVIEGTTSIDPAKSTYIQYYVGKEYPDTLSNCIYSAGINAKSGNFKLMLPVSKLKGPGTYQIVFEQNPRSNKILPPELWMAFRKVDGKIIFGEISSMGEVANLAETFGMKIAGTKVIVGNEKVASPITITSACKKGSKIIVKGKSDIDPKISTYIQYYVGKLYEGTLSNCIYCDGFNADDKGNFKLEIPVDKLKGNGSYSIVLEQNPGSNKILPPKHWIAFRKVDGKVVFGDISSMGEISNLALTVGMKAAATEVTVGSSKKLKPKIKIASALQEGEFIVVKGKTKVKAKKSTYIQYYVGKQYPDTLTNCIVCDGFNANKNGPFELKIPVSTLKGPGNYEIALEQNPESDKILAPKYWMAVQKVDGKVVFGDISSMGEISNLALTVGMELARGEFSVK